MIQYIDKDAVVAELKRRIQESLDAGGATRGVYLSERIKEDSYILSFLDTIEVKEVDLEKEMNNYFVSMKVQEHENIFESTFRQIAKHFYELGIKAKGE